MQMTDRTMIEFVEDAAKEIDGPPVPQEFINEALLLIHNGLIEVPRQPNGTPSPKGIYKLAVKLESESATKN